MAISRILCVHECVAVLLELEKTLESAGYEVIAASSGEQALHIIAQERVDGVVLGYDVEALGRRSLRKLVHHLYPELPMLLFSEVDEIRNIPLHVFRAYLEHPGPPAAVLTTAGV
jgi:DNA-binding NtrC family response regulator